MEPSAGGVQEVGLLKVNPKRIGVGLIKIFLVAVVSPHSFVTLILIVLDPEELKTIVPGFCEVEFGGEAFEKDQL
jgi:hypothetical protein